ncbi:MAG: DNA mismatch repair endonuclease MutL, partial [Myxococcota bacterium]
ARVGALGPGVSERARSAGVGSSRRLDDALIDQIAAGEVVERPASVVKELVENALDAGARSIRVELREGGASFIAVTDDGRGMRPAEARLALERHATSKIREQDDLTRIASFGFRGEALPSIASVARLRLRSRARDTEEGVEIRMEGGRLTSERPAGGPEGTRVEVADLFVHVPARRKFLKRPATEWSHIADWLARSALVLPEVRFEVQRDERPPTVWPATTEPLDRIAAVLGDDEAASLLAVEGEDGAGRLQAFVSAPERTRPNTQGLYLFVNGRPVRDPLIRSAVLQSYRDWLPRGRFPTAIVFLDVPPEQVDVNVHPAKWEVRFAEPQGIRQLIRRSLRSAVEGRSWLGSAPAPSPDPHPGQMRPAETPGRAPAARTLFGEGDRARATHAAASGDAAPGDASPGDWAFAGGARAVADAPDPSEVPADPGPRHLRFGDLRLIGQWTASYLIAEAKDGLLLIDQHAAHERVLYERLRSEWLERGVERQGLLAPALVELDPSALARFLEHAGRVERLGFEVEPFGTDSVAVRAVPALLGDRDPVRLVRELADELTAEAGEDDGADQVRALAAADRIFATLACHSARRFGDHLEPAEQRALLDALDAIPWAPTCPHGRPVAVRLDRSDIERRFGRR